MGYTILGKPMFGLVMTLMLMILRIFLIMLLYMFEQMPSKSRFGVVVVRHRALYVSSSGTFVCAHILGWLARRGECCCSVASKAPGISGSYQAGYSVNVTPEQHVGQAALLVCF